MIKAIATFKLVSGNNNDCTQTIRITKQWFDELTKGKTKVEDRALAPNTIDKSLYANGSKKQKFMYQMQAFANDIQGKLIDIDILPD